MVKKLHLNESRSYDIEQMMNSIEEALYHYDDIQDILLSHNANPDNSGEDGFFSSMTDNDIKGAWKDIKDFLQIRYSAGYEIPTTLLELFDIQWTKEDFKRTYKDMKYRISGSSTRSSYDLYAEGFCEAVSMIKAAYGIDID